MTDSQARGYIERVRWPNGPVCPHCGNDEKEGKKIYKLKGTATRPGLYKCGACRKQFTVTVGTVMHRSHIDLKQWLLAFHLLCAGKKGVAALEFQRVLGLGSYKSAWFLAHRIRAAMKEEPLANKLTGIIEADETYIGGKSHEGKRGRGSERKTPVLSLVQRDGEVRSKPVERVDGENLKGEILANVDESATIVTDEFASYRGIGKFFDGGHHTVSHGEGEYSRKEGDTSIHVNTSESFFSLIKRGHYGVYHSMGRKHLHRYCSEFDFRWVHRKETDGERTNALIKQVEGKRLMYRVPRA